MARQTKAQQAERQEAITQLREWIKPGDTVYTILDHVSSSGMSRAIRVVVPYTREDGTIDHLHPNYAIGRALGLKHWKRHGREQDALVVGGCGMDMGFHLVYELSHVLYGTRPSCRHCHQAVTYDGAALVDATGGDVCGVRDADTGTGQPHELVGGYRCLGKGKCPSNYHNNHHDTIRCEGTMVWNNDGPNTGSPCYAPNSRLFGPHEDVPATWPTRRYELGEGAYIDVPCYAIQDGDSAPIVCPTCHGDGRIPNPEGPERFDLVHTDGYALRHRWL